MSFTNGTTIKLVSDSLLVAVGPNNSGKSALLRSIISQIRETSPEIQKSPLAAFSLVRSTPFEDVLRLIEHARTPSSSTEPLYQLPGYSFYESNARGWWQGDQPLIGYFGRLVISELATRTRLTDCDLQSSFDPFEPKDGHHPFQRMYSDPDLEAKVSGIVRRAFKKDLIVQRAGASKIPVYVDNKFARESGDEQYSAQYVQKLQRLDRLEFQGDGIRSFVSIAARVLTEQRPIQIIDEPEAFLHPPQARLIGEVIASYSTGRQALVATHSSDVLQGLLADGASRVTVVRLSRTKDGGQATFLPADQVAALWNDPILRFSNILDGLFHDAVVLAEGDSDCRFYEAIAKTNIPGETRPDVHYTYAGGKGRLPTVIKALKGLNVPVATVVDFDVLNAEHPIKDIVGAQGGDWSAIKPDWLRLKGFVETNPAFVGADQYREKVETLLASCPPGGVVPKETLSEIEKLSKRASPWQLVKEKGLHGLPSGEATEVGELVLQKLAEIGIFVAPNGAVEGFYASLGGKGRRWLEKVFKKDLGADPKLRDARSFVGAIFDRLVLETAATAKLTETNPASSAADQAMAAAAI